MALIAVAVYDTDDNKRSWMTRRTLESLAETVDLGKHRIVVIDNNSCDATQRLYSGATVFFKWWHTDHLGPGNFKPFELIQNKENRGTAKAINQAWLLRKPGENCLKVDNDVVVKQKNWIDILEECVQRESKIGIIGLKRKDLLESPLLPKDDPYRSELVMLPHQPGERWLSIEKVQHVIGTCCLFSSALLDKIGFLYQMGGPYAWDDGLAAARAEVAGFISCFYGHVEIDHIDPGGDEYTKWKADYAGKTINKFFKVREEYYSGARSIYHGPDD